MFGGQVFTDVVWQVRRQGRQAHIGLALGRTVGEEPRLMPAFLLSLPAGRVASDASEVPQRVRDHWAGVVLCALLDVSSHVGLYHALQVENRAPGSLGWFTSRASPGLQQLYKKRNPWRSAWGREWQA